MQMNEIRKESIERAKRAGLSVLPTLPLRDPDLYPRSQEDILGRLLCLTAVAASSYGFDKSKAYDWLRQEHADSLLTHAERDFLTENTGELLTFQVQVEGMWVLAWALNLVPQLDFWKECDNDFVTILPNLKTMESSSRLRANSRLRRREDILRACDLAYCLHWVFRQGEITRTETRLELKTYVILERRRALEWIVADDLWDEITLDT
jgi:hypothetical protein